MYWMFLNYEIKPEFSIKCNLLEKLASVIGFETIEKTDRDRWAKLKSIPESLNTYWKLKVTQYIYFLKWKLKCKKYASNVNYL